MPRRCASSLRGVLGRKTAEDHDQTALRELVHCDRIHWNTQTSAPTMTYAYALHRISPGVGYASDER